MAMRGEERGIKYITLSIDICPPLQEKRGDGSLTIGTSPHQSTPAILHTHRERMREMAMRGEEWGIEYTTLHIDICPPLQEKRGGGSLTIGTSKDQGSVAPLERESERWQWEERKEGLDTLAWRLISAPLSRRREAVAVWPLAQAKIKALQPFYRERIRDMAMKGKERVEERERERREGDGIMRGEGERIGVLGKIKRRWSYHMTDHDTHMVSLIDVRILRGSLQEGPHLVPFVFRSSFDQSHARCCVCGESVWGRCVSG
jgi:hypothetical protein